jgi:hypothetical protein
MQPSGEQAVGTPLQALSRGHAPFCPGRLPSVASGCDEPPGARFLFRRMPRFHRAHDVLEPFLIDCLPVSALHNALTVASVRAQ